MAEIKDNLNPRQLLFCQLYASDREFFGNGVQSYIEAYDIDLTKRNAYNSARSAAQRLLTNDNILAYIRELIDIKFSDEMADKELAFVAIQHADFPSKIAAIREYNKLKKRVTDTVDLNLKDSRTEEEVRDELDKRLKALGYSRVKETP